MVKGVMLSVFGVALLALAGCSSPVPPPPRVALTPEERANAQTRLYEAPFDTVFAATLAVLQDLGWSLDSVDKSSGLIRATTRKRLEKLSPVEENIADYDLRLKTIKSRADPQSQWTRWEVITIHTEPWKEGRTRQRIVVLRWGSLPPMSYPARIEGEGSSRRKDVVINAPAKEVSVELDLPEPYAALFARINRAAAERLSR